MLSTITIMGETGQELQAGCREPQDAQRMHSSSPGFCDVAFFQFRGAPLDASCYSP